MGLEIQTGRKAVQGWAHIVMLGEQSFTFSNEEDAELFKSGAECMKEAMDKEAGSAQKDSLPAVRELASLANNLSRMQSEIEKLRQETTKYRRCARINAQCVDAQKREVEKRDATIEDLRENQQNVEALREFAITQVRSLRNKALETGLIDTEDEWENHKELAQALIGQLRNWPENCDEPDTEDADREGKPQPPSGEWAVRELKAGRMVKMRSDVKDGTQYRFRSTPYRYTGQTVQFYHEFRGQWEHSMFSLDGIRDYDIWEPAENPEKGDEQ